MRARVLALAVLAACSEKAASAPPDAGAPAADGGPAAVDGGDGLLHGVVGLAPGEVVDVELDTDGHGALRLAVPDGGERFVAIVVSTRTDTGTPTHAYAVTADAEAQTTAARRATGCAIDAARFAGAAVPTEAAPTGAAPAVGATRTLNVSTATGTEAITAKVLATSARAIVWADATTAHPATFDAGFVEDFLAEFDGVILPRARQVFGVESDLDHDGRVSLVFSPIVRSTAVAFFTGCDLAPEAGCPAGNGGEFLYLTPPANIDPPYNTPNAVKEILAHELGHLVHFNRKAMRSGLTAFPDSAYMIEGFGAFAQDVLGWQSGNLYVTQAGLAELDQFTLADVLGARSRYDAARDGLLRGGAYLFVRWMYDRAGGDAARGDGTIEGRGGPALLAGLFEGKDAIAARLPAVGGGALPDAVTDFYTTLALSNGAAVGQAAPQNPCFAFRPVETDPVTKKPRGADVHAKFHGTQEMPGVPLQALGKADGKLRAGGADYVTIPAGAEAELGLAIRVDPTAKPRVRIARVK